MPTETTNFELLRNLIDKLDIFLHRPQVQSQLLAIGAAILIGWLISRVVWFILARPLHHFINRWLPLRIRPFFHLTVALLRTTTFPTLSLGLLWQAQQRLLLQNQVVGLLEKSTWILWTILTFQIIITLLYTSFEAEKFRRYHYRLLIPLLLVSIFLAILDNLTDLSNIANIVLTTIFDNQITLGALFIATFGLYFWTDAVYVASELLYELVQKHTAFDPGGTKAMLTLGRYVLIIAGVVVALNQLQLDATTLAAITGGLSVGIGFGLREILSNFISGVLLLFERSLHPGDVIEIDGELSVVRDFSIRATVVHTLNNVELVIPNQTFFTSSFKTYTGSDKKVRVPIRIQTDCQITPEHVITVMKEAALAQPEVLKDPAPSVFLLEYGNNVADFQLNIWLADPMLIPEVRSVVKTAVWHSLENNDIHLPFPDMQLHFPDQLPPMEIATRRNGRSHHHPIPYPG